MTKVDFVYYYFLLLMSMIYVTCILRTFLIIFKFNTGNKQVINPRKKQNIYSKNEGQIYRKYLYITMIFMYNV
jgi:hypothetical protein